MWLWPPQVQQTCPWAGHILGDGVATFGTLGTGREGTGVMEDAVVFAVVMESKVSLALLLGLLVLLTSKFELFALAREGPDR